MNNTLDNEFNLPATELNSELFEEDIGEKPSWFSRLFNKPVVYATASLLTLLLLLNGCGKKPKYKIPFNQFLPVTELIEGKKFDIHCDNYKGGVAELKAYRISPEDTTHKDIYAIVISGESQDELKALGKNIAKHGAIMLEKPPLDRAAPSMIEGGAYMPLVYAEITKNGLIIYADENYVSTIDATRYKVEPGSIKSGNLYKN